MDPGKKLSLRQKIFGKLPKSKTIIDEEESVHGSNPRKDATILATVEEPGDPFADCGSDSDGSSSVGDHLVSLEDIDLDSNFFSQGFKPNVAVENEGDVSSSFLARNFKPEVGIDERESDSDSDGNEAIHVMLSQLVDYGRTQEEARRVFESYACKSENLDSIESERKQADVSKALHEAEDPTVITRAKVEASDEEWQHVEDFSDDDGRDIEVVVGQQTTTKAGKVIDVDAQLRRLLQSENREKQLQLHKTHLLCLLGNGFHLNGRINSLVSSNSEELFQILEHFDIETPDETEIDYLITICDIYRSIGSVLETSQAIFKTNVQSQSSNILLLIAILRFLSIEARLVMHLNVVPKSPIQTKVKIRPASYQEKLAHIPNSIDPLPPERYKNVPLTTAEILKQKPEFVNFSQIPQIDGAADDCGKPRRSRLYGPLNDPKSNLSKRRTKSSRTTAEIGKQKSEFDNFSQIPQIDGATDEFEKQKRPRLDGPLTDPKPNLWKLKLKQPVDMRSKLNIQCGKRKIESSQTTSKFFNQPKSKKLRQKMTEEIPPASSERLTHWIEVFLPAQKRWIPVDILSGQVDCLDAIVQSLPQPIAYVFGWSNDGSLQDVTGRYWWPNEMASRRLRMADKWLHEVMRHFGRRRKSMQDLLDEQEIRRLRFRAPVPDKVSDFKNHPSYCLKRDLLKFQAIYPPDAPPLGYFREEPIYARECVHTLHSREVWLRHAKVIRLRETPYKVVWSKLKREKTELELFGYWQTEEYVPPEAVGGRVPRNAYGNIEIFKECMLPKGTVHLKQINISKTCRRLNMDYAIAVVGFGIHAGGNHPVFEGIVICKEFEQQVLAQYEQDQLKQVRRQHEKREKKIYDNWRKLIRGLLVRNKLQNKYNFENL